MGAAQLVTGVGNGRLGEGVHQLERGRGSTGSQPGLDTVHDTAEMLLNTADTDIFIERFNLRWRQKTFSLPGAFKSYIC